MTEIDKLRALTGKQPECRITCGGVDLSALLAEADRLIAAIATGQPTETPHPSAVQLRDAVIEACRDVVPYDVRKTHADDVRALRAAYDAAVARPDTFAALRRILGAKEGEGVEAAAERAMSREFPDSATYERVSEVLCRRSEESIIGAAIRVVSERDAAVKRAETAEAQLAAVRKAVGA